MSEHADTSRATIKTYVPTYQKERWAEHAEDLDMSLSEFVRTMVQAGRRGFEPATEEPGSPDATPGGDTLETTVLDLIESDVQSWDDLLDAVTGDIESQLESTLNRLQSTNRITHSPRKDGYVLLEGDRGGD